MEARADMSTQGQAFNAEHIAFAIVARDSIDALEQRCEQLSDELASAIARAEKAEQKLADASALIATLLEQCAPAVVEE
jgi:BMFP domain-containing protein YqiC